MKPQLLFIKLLFIFGLTSLNISAQQFLVNSEWVLTFGNDTSQYFYKKATVKTDTSNNVYTLGNSITSTGMIFY